MTLERMTGLLKRAGMICGRCGDLKLECKCLEDHMTLERQPDNPGDLKCRYCDSPNVAFSKAVSGISEDGLVEHEGVEYACFECIDPVSEKGWERL